MCLSWVLSSQNKVTHSILHSLKNFTLPWMSHYLRISPFIPIVPLRGSIHLKLKIGKASEAQNWEGIALVFPQLEPHDPGPFPMSVPASNNTTHPTQINPEKILAAPDFAPTTTNSPLQVYYRRKWLLKENQ